MKKKKFRMARELFIEKADAIIQRLDVLIEILTLRASIDQARTEMRKGEYVPGPLSCTCGKGTGTIYACPVHG